MAGRPSSRAAVIVAPAGRAATIDSPGGAGRLEPESRASATVGDVSGPTLIGGPLTLIEGHAGHAREDDLGGHASITRFTGPDGRHSSRPAGATKAEEIATGIGKFP